MQLSSSIPHNIVYSIQSW